MVESPTRPWSSLSCYEATPSIQVSLYRSPNLDDRIFDCLLKAMAAVQAEDVHASFQFVDDFNGHHQKWLGSTTTNRHGVAAFDFTTVTGCD